MRFNPAINIVNYWNLAAFLEKSKIEPAIITGYVRRVLSEERKSRWLL